jgi:hypothetical protein
MLLLLTATCAVLRWKYIQYPSPVEFGRFLLLPCAFRALGPVPAARLVSARRRARRLLLAPRPLPTHSESVTHRPPSFLIAVGHLLAARPSLPPRCLRRLDSSLLIRISNARCRRQFKKALVVWTLAVANAVFLHALASDCLQNCKNIAIALHASSSFVLCRSPPSADDEIFNTFQYKTIATRSPDAPTAALPLL